MEMITRKQWQVYDGPQSTQPRQLPAGKHEVERTIVEIGGVKIIWLVLKGTQTGASEAFFRQWQRKGLGNAEITIKE